MKKTASEIRTVLKGMELGLSAGQIASQTGLAKSTAQRVMACGKEAKLSYSAAKLMTDLALEEIFSPKRRTVLNYAEPDWEFIYLQHARKTKPVELKVLWEAYAKDVPEGLKPLSYQAFCNNYGEYTRGLPAKLKDVAMTFHWEPGDVVMIDYSGDTVTIVTPDGKTCKAQIFVGVLPHSDYLFCWATPDQTRNSWLSAIPKLLEFIKGTTNYIYLDNATPLVNKADRFNPKICAEFQAFCGYYHITPYVCRPGEPRDKALVENAVGIIQRKILNPLHGQAIPGLEELNKILLQRLQEVNALPMVEKMQSRSQIFEEEAKFLQPLPSEPYDPEVITKALKVRSDYRVRYKDRRFSVPYRYVGQSVKVVIYPHKNILDCFDLRTGERIAHHVFTADSDRDSVSLEHMPEKHLALVRTLEALIDMLALAGPRSRQMAELVAKQNQKRIANRLLNGLLSAQHRVGNGLFEACCRETLKRPSPNYESLLAEIDRQIGVCNNDQQVITLPHGAKLSVKHETKNVRGAEYYRSRSKKMDKEA